MQEVFVPDIGDFKEVDVVEVLVKAGDTVAAEQSLITVESDKATMEIPSPAAGVVKELRIRVGDKVSEGTAILVLEGGAAASDAAAASAPAPAPAASAYASAPAVAGPAAAPASPPQAAATGAGALREVNVPDIGDFESVDVVEVLVKAGDTVAAEQSLITVESDKATMDIPSPAAGVVKEVRVKAGDKVSEGSPVLVLEEAGPAAAASAPAPSKAAAVAPPPAAATTPSPAAASRASSASIWRGCAAAGLRAASCSRTCRRS
jgi:pyruvate dehydrogenase E2 component (dihydrolipoamide acetyltransferase)